MLIDRDQETADKGKAGVHKTLTDRVNKGRMKSAERDALLEKITTTADYGALKDCDLVVEAVFEDRKVKADVIAKIQAAIGPDTVFASNTSTLPITSLAAEFKRPAAFHRHPFLLAGRPHAAGRDHPRQDRPATRRLLPRSISCARSARRRSWSTTAAASTPIAACSITSRKAI